MSARPCPVPGCAETVPTGQLALFCASHHFVLPVKETRFLFRWQAKMVRCQDTDTRQHMAEQLHGYIARAIRLIETSEAKTSQTAPERARPLALAAGATHSSVCP